MFLKDFIIRTFPGLYIRKNFSALNQATFRNYQEKQIEPELLLLPMLLNEEKVFVDVGSNKGLFLFIALRKVKAKKIFAVEPNPILFKKIRSVFKNVKIFNRALSDHYGEAVLTIPFTEGQPDDSLASIQAGESSQNAFNFKVAVDTLDRLSDEWRGNETGFIKIDVEGHELEVLNGSEGVIAKDRPVLLVEIEQRHHQQPVKSIINDLCRRYNYQAYYFLPSKHRLVRFSDEPVIYQNKKDFGSIHYVNNFFFLDEKFFPASLIKKINAEIEVIRKK